MSTTALPNLSNAVALANEHFMPERVPYIIEVAKQGTPKEPVYLQLAYADGTTKRIGVTHLVHIRGANWDAKSYEELVRTTDEVARSIVARVNLFLKSEKEGRLYIAPSGTIFDFNGMDVRVEADNTFSVDGVPVTYQERRLPLRLVLSEGVVTFTRLSDGRIKLVDPLDLRGEARGIFIRDGKVSQVLAV